MSSLSVNLSEAQQFLSDSEKITGGATDDDIIRHDRPEPSWIVVVLLVGGFLVVLVGLPFYNKQIFRRVSIDEKLPKHTATVALVPTVVMLLGAAVVMSLLEVLRHRFLGAGERSWLLGPGFRRKALYLLIPALLFGAVMGLTNTSLSLTSVNLHVLLRTSMIVWLVGGAWLVEGERPTLLTLLWCLLLAVGAVLASLQPEDTWSSYWLAILLTALSALAQGALLVATRRTARLLGTKASLEVAAFKALVAACVLLPLAGGLDPGGFARLSMLSGPTIGFLVGGVFVTTLFQTLLVALQSVTLATSAGVLSVFATIPQILIGLIITPQQLAPVQIVGYVLAPLAAVAYAIERIVRTRRARRMSKYVEGP